MSFSLHHVCLYLRPLQGSFKCCLCPSPCREALCGCALCKHLVTAAVQRLTTEQ